jgi:ElaB/YqjD/DUF883 family membrane-anchored ribosome-binding protein
MDRPRDTNLAEETMRDAGSSARRELQEKAHIVREDLRDLASSAGNLAREQLDPLEAYVKEHPLTSVLIAAGIGVVAGLIVRRD